MELFAKVRDTSKDLEGTVLARKYDVFTENFSESVRGNNVFDRLPCHYSRLIAIDHVHLKLLLNRDGGILEKSK